MEQIDKPVSMTVKEYIIRVMSLRTNTPIKTIETVINHQFEEANKAFNKDYYSIELAGFCTFRFNGKKARKKYDKNVSKANYFYSQLLKDDLTDKERESLTNKLNNTLAWIDTIKPKIKDNEFFSDIEIPRVRQVDPQGITEHS